MSDADYVAFGFFLTFGCTILGFLALALLRPNVSVELYAWLWSTVLPVTLVGDAIGIFLWILLFIKAVIVNSEPYIEGG